MGEFIVPCILSHPSGFHIFVLLVVSLVTQEHLLNRIKADFGVYILDKHEYFFGNSTRLCKTDYYLAQWLNGLCLPIFTVTEDVGSRCNVVLMISE
jgi:hypothetical protein